MSRIKAFLTHRALVTVVQLLMGAFFILASIGKIIDPWKFMGTVYSYVLLPPALVPVFSFTLPWVEFTIGILLILDLWAKSAAILATGSMCMFLGAILIEIARGVEISCGCFDFLFPNEEIGWRTMVRDFSMLFMAGYLIFVTGNRVRLHGLIRPKSGGHRE